MLHPPGLLFALVPSGRFTDRRLCTPSRTLRGEGTSAIEGRGHLRDRNRGYLKGSSSGAILQAMDITTYSTWLEIDLGAIKHNVKEIIKMTNTEVMAVIKANGYGHGHGAA